MHTIEELLILYYHYHTIIKFDIVPGPPTIIKLTPLLNTAIVVDFAPPIDANGLITKYRLSVKEEMTSYQIEIDTDVTSATINDLSAYTSYHVKVQWFQIL